MRRLSSRSCERKRARRFNLALWFSALFCLHGHAATPARDLADLSLEELANIEVTSVSKSAEPLADAPASIFVISNDDIRRAGVRTLSEALRLAPNLQVARTSANSYAISARGFNNSIGNKLLVLIDGRTVYTPLFSGVFWDQQDVMLEDVERIEVISGPGATLWGANAVNGVINVITRSSRDTQGALAAIGAGNLDQGVALRYGGKLGEDGTFRIYGKGRDLENTKRADGSAVPDGWDNGQVGFRADWNGSRRSFTVQGDAYRGRSEDRPLGGPIEVSGANLLARWNERFSSGSDIRLQAYYDRSERQDRIGFQGDVDTFDIDFQHGIPLGRHKLLWGAGYRRAHDNVPDTIPTPLVIRFVPSSRTLDWQNLFAQDEIRLTDSLDFTAGLKLESNDYTGWDALPSARFPIPSPDSTPATTDSAAACRRRLSSKIGSKGSRTASRRGPRFRRHAHGGSRADSPRSTSTSAWNRAAAIPPGRLRSATIRTINGCCARRGTSPATRSWTLSRAA
jgi:iron complex outermembrane receptor protein